MSRRDSRGGLKTRHKDNLSNDKVVHWWCAARAHVLESVRARRAAARAADSYCTAREEFLAARGELEELQAAMAKCNEQDAQLHAWVQHYCKDRTTVAWLRAGTLHPSIVLSSRALRMLHGGTEELAALHTEYKLKKREVRASFDLDLELRRKIRQVTGRMKQAEARYTALWAAFTPEQKNLFYEDDALLRVPHVRDDFVY